MLPASPKGVLPARPPVHPFIMRLMRGDAKVLEIGLGEYVALAKTPIGATGGIGRAEDNAQVSDGRKRFSWRRISYKHRSRAELKRRAGLSVFGTEYVG